MKLTTCSIRSIVGPAVGKKSAPRPLNRTPLVTTKMGRRSAGVLFFVAALSIVAAGCSGDETAAEDSSTATQDSQLAFNDSTTTAPVTTVPDADMTEYQPPVTEGSGLEPVTTIQGRAVGDPENLYTGVIGKLGLNEVVVKSNVPAPKVAAGVFPLTGIKAGPEGVPDRPAAVVKVDNGGPASPHDGLNAADIVIEEEVEGGVTRFASIFHSRSSIVGPVRSGRSTDLSLISSLGTPLLMYSGANDVTEGILRSQTKIQNRNYETSSGYWRDAARKAPSNLFTDTAPHWASASGGAPPPQFAYRAAGTKVDKGVDTKSFTVDYSSSTAKWDWDGKAWLRSQRGKPHILQSGQQVSAANVVVIEAARVGTGLVDAAGGVVPEFVFVGTGDATVFVDGKQIAATWTRSTLASVATLVAADGSTVELAPGRTWLQLIETNSGLLQADS